MTRKKDHVVWKATDQQANPPLQCFSCMTLRMTAKNIKGLLDTEEIRYTIHPS